MNKQIKCLSINAFEIKICFKIFILVIKKLNNWLYWIKTIIIFNAGKIKE
jgi:hypothetical protein